MDAVRVVARLVLPQAVEVGLGPPDEAGTPAPGGVVVDLPRQRSQILDPGPDEDPAVRCGAVAESGEAERIPRFQPQRADIAPAAPLARKMVGSLDDGARRHRAQCQYGSRQLRCGVHDVRGPDRASPSLVAGAQPDDQRRSARYPRRFRRADHPQRRAHGDRPDGGEGQTGAHQGRQEQFGYSEEHCHRPGYHREQECQSAGAGQHGGPISGR